MISYAIKEGDTHSLHLYILISFSSPECLALVSLLPWYLYLQYCLLIDDLGRQRQLFILNQPYIFLRFFSLSARVSPVSHMASITTPLAGVSCASLPLLPSTEYWYYSQLLSRRRLHVKVTDYSQIVSHKMDVDTVKTKVKNSRYPHVAAFFSDLLLVYENAVKYYENCGKLRDKLVYEAAKVYMKKRCKNHVSYTGRGRRGQRGSCDDLAAHPPLCLFVRL